MSLYFNWSCDFQRFTKSKKLSKFQVRTTTLFISNKILSTSLFNLQGAICCFQAFFRTFRSSEPLFNSLFIISDCFSFVKNFFKNFFEVFEADLSKFKLFWPPSLSKQLIYYIKLKSVCQELFSFFSSRFSVWPPCLSATALIEYHSTPPPVNKNFQFFSYFLKLVVSCFLCYNKYRTLRTKPQRCLYLP